MRRTVCSVGIGILVLIGSCSSWGADRFIVLPTPEASWARDVSADGSTVVGESGVEAFRWTEGGGYQSINLGIGGGTAHGVSGDGGVIVGSFTSAGGVEQPYRWTATNGAQSIAPNLMDGGVALGVSADGSVVVGEFGQQPLVDPGCENVICDVVDTGSVSGFRWTQADGFVALGTVTGTDGSQATTVSGDGSIIAGNEFSYDSICSPRPEDTCAPFRFLGLPFIADGTGLSGLGATLQPGDIVAKVSADGSTLVGREEFEAPFRWQAELGFQNLGRRDPLEFLFDPNITARDVTADGSLVVGDFGIWHKGRNVRLKNLLANGFGLDVAGWTLSEPANTFRFVPVAPLFGNVGLTGVSDDGRVMVGAGLSPSGNVQAFVVQMDAIPDEAVLDALPEFEPSQLIAAALPLTRSAVVNQTVSVFATLTNRSETTQLEGCRVKPQADVPITFSFQTTDPLDNQVTGNPNAPITIAPLGSQTLVLAFTPTGAFPPTVLSMIFDCGNTDRAELFAELNDIVISASDTPVPDIFALARTPSADGIAMLDEGGVGMFVISTFNLGNASDIAIEPRAIGASVDVMICETDRNTGECLAPPASAVTLNYAADEVRTYGLFLQSDGFVFPNYAARRIVVEFRDAAGNLRGSTSVAVASNI